MLIDRLFNFNNYDECRINKHELTKENQFAKRQHIQVLKAMAVFSLALLPLGIIGYFFGVIGMGATVLIVLIDLVIDVYYVLSIAK